jgi:hypothetical protein
VRNFSQENREKFLIGMMKVNFLKRLESSVKSFAITMERTVSKIEDLEERLSAYQKLRDGKAQDLQATLFLMEAEEDEELREAFEVGTLKYRMEHMDVDRWLADLTTDKRQLSMLAESAGGVTPERDAKLTELKTIIKDKVSHQTQHQQPGRGQSQGHRLLRLRRHRRLSVRATGAWASRPCAATLRWYLAVHRPNAPPLGAPEFNQILTNFAPRAKQRAKMSSMPQTAARSTS